MSTGCDVAAMNECQCASMRPGIKTRPFPAITWTFAFPSTVIGLVDNWSMAFPLINTLQGADNVAPVPSTTRTFWKSVTVFVTGATAGSKPGTSMS